MRTIPFKPVLSILVMGCFLFNANAQKLPNVQSGSVRAPANIKIDGKTTEWNNKFQAHNHATDIFYTLSNDDNYLYLTVQATDGAIIDKIISGGIAFTIQTSGKRTDKGGVSITYPLFDKNNKPVIPTKLLFSTTGESEQTQSSPENYKPPGDLIAQVNKQLMDRSKIVGVTGIQGVDTLLSVYNDIGIKTAERLDDKGAYTYELAVDFKKLGLSVNSQQKFAYHIRLNGDNTDKAINSGEGSSSTPVFTSASGITMSEHGVAPTDLWGEYTLAKP